MEVAPMIGRRSLLKGVGLAALASLGTASCVPGQGRFLPIPPRQALSSGYRRLVFHDDFDDPGLISPDGTGDYNWYATQFFSDPVPASNYAIRGGVLTVFGGNGAGATLATAAPGVGLRPYQGRAFKRGYFEARLRFDPALAAKDIFWPAFWSSSVEHGIGETRRWGEIDFMEAALINTGPGAYAATVHDYTGPTWPPQEHVWNENNVIHLPSGTDLNEYHVYGCLWTPGRIEFYFDDRLGATVSWQPGQTFDVLDRQSMYLVLGTDGGWPMQVDWVRVWQ
jgi:Glycosyl hydrolases family 16